MKRQQSQAIRNRQRRQAAKARKHTPPATPKHRPPLTAPHFDVAAKRREVEAPGYRAGHDPEFIKGIAAIVRAIQFSDDCKHIGGHCLFRALVAHQVIAACQQSARLHVGSLLYRVGPDPYRDVVAFCGPGNAGISQLFHAWVEIDDLIADFSVGDWRGIDPVATERAAGLPALGPVHWTVMPPAYWCRPRRELVAPWQATGTPSLGAAWYGPFNGAPLEMANRIRLLFADVGQQITDAVETVVARFAQQHGHARSPRIAQPFPIMPIIETGQKFAPPAGYQQVMLSEIIRLVGGDLGAVPDAVSYVSRMPTTREEALALLRNMSLTAPQR